MIYFVHAVRVYIGLVEGTQRNGGLFSGTMSESACSDRLPSEGEVMHSPQRQITIAIPTHIISLSPLFLMNEIEQGY